jgi:UDP-N-acetylmuramate dehydrogenase
LGVQRVLESVHAAGTPLFVLGRGSNVLVSDHGWQGVTLYIGENLTGMQFTDLEADALAGTLLMDLIGAALSRGLGGMRFWRDPGRPGGACG